MMRLHLVLSYGLAACGLAATAAAQCPYLTASTPDRLPNITAEAFVLKGTAMKNVTRVTFGTTKITSQSPNDWDIGFFRIVDDYTLAVHPPQALVPAKFSLQAHSATCTSNALVVEIFKPVIRYARTNDTLNAGLVQTIRACKADMPDSTVGILAISGSKQPSTLPGIITLGLGNGFLELFLIPVAVPFHTQTNTATWNLQTPSTLRSVTLHFQVILIDALKPNARPILTTDVYSTTYL